MRFQAGAAQLLAEQLVYAADHLLGALLLHRLAIESQHRQRQFAVVGQELARNDLIDLEGGDDGVVSGVVLWQVVRNDWGRIAGGVRLAACRQH